MIAFRDHFGYRTPGDEAFRAGVRRLLGDADTEFILAAPGGGAAIGVAVLRYRWSLWGDSPDCVLEDAYVDPAARGAGTGRALIAFAVERARDRGCRRMLTDTGEDNAAALALYHAAGFSERGASGDGPRELFLRLILD